MIFFRNSGRQVFRYSDFDSVKLGRNVFEYLLTELSQGKGTEYSAMLGLRLCGMGIWGGREKIKSKFRYPYSMKFEELK